MSQNQLTRRHAAALIGAGALLPLGACRASKTTDPEVYYTTLREVARRIQSRDVSPVDLTRLMLDRIAKVDPHLKSYATVMADQALAAAAAALQEIQAGRYRGTLHGVPIAVKDLCYTKGVRTMGGTAVLKDFVPSFDSTVASRACASAWIGTMR